MKLRNYCVYFTSKFRSDQIKTITGNQQRIWRGSLNRFLTKDTVIKNKPFGFFVSESKGEVNIKNETAKTRKRPCQKYKKRQNMAVSQTDLISLMLVEILSIK